MAEEIKTQQELQTLLQAAMAKGDMQEVIRIAGQLKKASKGKEDAELEAKKTQITDLAEKVKASFVGLIDKFGADIVTLVGEKKAIIKLDWDYEGQLPTVKIVKGSTVTRKAGGSGGGNPQKFEMKTEDMLASFGSQPYKETGKTFQEMWDSTQDKNARYSIRKALIKLQSAQ